MTMLKFTHAEQARTFLSLLRAWDVPPELDTPEAVSKHETARLLAFNLADASPILGAAMLIDLTQKKMIAEGQAPHRFWSLDTAMLSAALGDQGAAHLAAGVAGFWPKTCAETGQVEWTDCAQTGGDRNLIQIGVDTHGDQ